MNVYGHVRGRGRRRIDFLFTYWVVAWTVIYLATEIPYNPLFALLCESVIIAGASFYLLLQTNVDMYTFLLFQIMNFFTKAVPIYILWKQFPSKIDASRDAVVLLGVFAIYNLYLYAHDTNVFEVYSSLIHTVATGQYRPYLFS